VLQTIDDKTFALAEKCIAISDATIAEPENGQLSEM